MITTLSKRLNPDGIGLSYPNTTRKLKNQIITIIMDCIESLSSIGSGRASLEFADDYYHELCRVIGTDIYEREYGPDLFNLKIHLDKMNGEQFLDALDVFVQMVYLDEYVGGRIDIALLFKDINDVLKNNGIDLKVIDGKCWRISDPMIQCEVISPAFEELKRFGFTNAQQDLIEAFDHFKGGNNPMAILSANKALKSTIAYLLERFDLHPSKDKMASKIEVLIHNGILPSWYESSLTSLVKVLQVTSIIRNRNGGHGTSDETAVEDCYVQYAIDSAASAILFLVRLTNCTINHDCIKE